jgi:hypothetical protein
MKPKRVECDNCIHFIYPEFKKFGDKESFTVETKAKCNLGKRVMFRMPDNLHIENMGYFRYCIDFKNLNNEN